MSVEGGKGWRRMGTKNGMSYTVYIPCVGWRRDGDIRWAWSDVVVVGESKVLVLFSRPAQLHKKNNHTTQ